MLVVLIDIIICTAFIILIKNLTEKKEHRLLKRIWWSAAAAGIVTTVADTLYNEKFGGSAGPFTIDIENCIFLIVIALSIAVFAICSVIAGIIYFNKMKPVYLQMVFAILLALGHNRVYRHLYISKGLTEINDHIWMNVTLGVTVLIYIFVMLIAAILMHKKQVRYYKPLYWLLPTIVLLLPVIILIDHSVIRWE